MSIAVIILSRGNKLYLNRSIKSVLLQKKLPSELILINNQQQEININLKKKIKLKIINVKNFKQELDRLNFLRNNSVKYVSSKYICFLDDDDYWDKNYINYCLNLIKRKNMRYLYSSFSTFGLVKKKYDLPVKFPKKSIFFINPGFLCSNLIIEKKLFISVNGFDESLSGSADKDLFLKIFDKTNQYNVSNNNLVKKYYGTSNWSNSFSMIYLQKLRFYKKYFFKISPRDHFYFWFFFIKKIF